jgi:endoglucanase
MKSWSDGAGGPMRTRIHSVFSAIGALLFAQLAAGRNPLSIQVQRNQFIDASGEIVQLRGVSISGLENTAIHGWAKLGDGSYNYWGEAALNSKEPNWATFKTWKANAVRLPLNEGSWLGYACSNPDGSTRPSDPGGRYRNAVTSSVRDATDAGLYVILDLHWSAPAKFCALAQNQMADRDNSLTFWGQVAATFKEYPNVLFELFNEPFVGYSNASPEDWRIIMRGGPQDSYVTGYSNAYQVHFRWDVAGMQQMLDAVRASGAKNVVLIGGASWAQDLSQWLSVKPEDPLHQIAAVWHAYPSKPGVLQPNFGQKAYSWAEGVLAAGYPVIITETGDHNAPGTVGSPFEATLLPWADEHGVSYIGWSWDVLQNVDNVLIKDAAGTPTDGYGSYFKQHLVCRAGGAARCP